MNDPRALKSPYLKGVSTGDFPAEHRMHLRTTNPLENTFATLRLRSAKAKGCGCRLVTLTMVFKLAMSARQGWRWLTDCELIRFVIAGVVFTDAVKQHPA